MLNDVFAAIGKFIVAAGGLVAIAFGFFKFFGEKWLNTKFEERLASFRHEQQKEIERLRLRINTLMDRTTKLHQREFDVLPEAWGRLNDAFVKTCDLPFRFERSLACTNSIENMMGTVRRVCRNVKRWRNVVMALRWTAAGMPEAAKGFRRLKARKQLPALRTALAAHHAKHVVTQPVAASADAA